MIFVCLDQFQGQKHDKKKVIIFLWMFRKMPGITHSKNFYQPSILSHKHSSFVCDMTYKSMLLPLFSNKQKMRTAFSVQSSCRSAEHVSERQAESFQHILSRCSNDSFVYYILSVWQKSAGCSLGGGTAKNCFQATQMQVLKGHCDIVSILVQIDALKVSTPLLLPLDQ